MTPHRHLGYPGLAAAALVLAACATLPAPTEQLAASRTAIQSAEVAGADQSATVELSQARDKLAAAQTAVNAGDNDRARRLADQALVDAQLAQAKASTTRARESVVQAEAALRALRDEANRPAAPPAASPPVTTPVAPVAPAAPVTPLEPVTPAAPVTPPR